LPATERVGIATVCFLTVLCNKGQDVATKNMCSDWSCSTEAFSFLLSAIREKPLSAYIPTALHGRCCHVMHLLDQIRQYDMGDIFTHT
jgi:hypothetical protein